MKLSIEEYERGVVSWDNDAVAVGVAIVGGSQPGEAPKDCVLLTEPEGSVVPVSLHPDRKISRHPRDLAASRSQGRPIRIRWEFQHRHRIMAKIWDSTDPLSTAERLHSVTIKDVPDFGCFYRLVLYAPYLQHSNGTVIRVDRTIIRFTKTIVGRQFKDLEQVEANGAYSLQTMHREGIFSGPFVEILTPAGASDSSSQAYSLLGFLALLLGENVLGEIAISERIEAASDGTTTTDIVLPARIPQLFTTNDLTTVDERLPVSPNDRGSHAVMAALRWYEHGLRSGIARDRLLSFFIGIEVIIREYARRAGFRSPLATVASPDLLSALLQPIADEHGNETIERLIGRLSDPQPSVQDCFEFYAKKHRWDESECQQFKRLSKLRNSAVHAGSTTIEEHQALGARAMLARLLRSELGLGSESDVQTQ